MKNGGTKMWCPNCKDITECKRIPPGTVGMESAQRWGRTDYTDIQWFRRVRQCLVCNEVFITAEMNEAFLDELVELRSALGEIKLNAEQYIEESASASKSLARLSGALKVLRALNLYKRENISRDDLDELFADTDE